jgi:hypothetical protein
VTLSRPLIIALGVVVFLVLSFMVARWLTQETRERGAVSDLLRAEARGDAAAMLRELPDCADEPACRAQIERNARTLRRHGDVEILSYQSATSYALGSARGLTRVAWRAGGPQSLPVVQCVDVVRRGIGFLNGDVDVRRIGVPIARTGTC